MSFDGRTIYPNLPETWAYIKVSDIADVNRLTITKRNEPSKILYIDISSVSNNQMEPPKYLDYSEAPSRAKRIVRSGDILISTVRPNLRQYVYIKDAFDNLVASTGFAVMSPHKDGYRRYLYAVLTSSQFTEHLVRVADGAVYPAFNSREISEAIIPWPGDSDLQAIDEFIGSVDDKIELNRRINQTLEEMAQAIFKSWFVDFEPVKAKIEARKNGRDPERAAMCAISGKNDAELDHLPPEQLAQLRATAALFPDELTDSELGLIPKGWEVSTIGKEFDATMGQSPPGHTYNEIGEGIPFFQGRRDFGWRYPANRVYCTEPKRFAKIGDTLLSVRAPVGDVNRATADCCIGRGIAALRHKSGCEAYTYYTVKRLEQYFSNFDTEGTVFGSINQKDLKAIKIIRPNRETLKIFSKFAENLDGQILNHEKQIATLAQLRDTLIPKLLSGEISVGAT